MPLLVINLRRISNDCEVAWSSLNSSHDSESAIRFGLEVRGVMESFLDCFVL
jgi:hypothetical protein